MSKIKIFALLYFSLLIFPAFSQDDDVEIDVPIVKNAISIRPTSMLFGLYGLSYERYITRNFSIVLYGERIEGPTLLDNGINAAVKRSMEVQNAKIWYTGFGIAPEIRKYIKLKKEDVSLVGNKDRGSLTGFFVGVYVPYRKIKFDMEVTSVEKHYNANQEDKGTYRFEGTLYGVGIEAGGHWVWGKFSLELVAGFSVMNGIDNPAKFNFYRPAIGAYSKDKNTGLAGTHILPKLGLHLGIAF